MKRSLKPKQLAFNLQDPTHGGRREGAGRKGKLITDVIINGRIIFIKITSAEGLKLPKGYDLDKLNIDPNLKKELIERQRLQ